MTNEEFMEIKAKLQNMGEKYISADSLMEVILSTLKPDKHPDEYIKDGQVVVPMEWLHLDDEE